MQKTEKLDMARLLGFDTVATELAGKLDFQDETLSDKLGAKVGPPEPVGPALFQDDNFASKLGAKVSVEMNGPALFQSEDVAAKLGAKVGDQEESAPR